MFFREIIGDPRPATPPALHHSLNIAGAFLKFAEFCTGSPRTRLRSLSPATEFPPRLLASKAGHTRTASPTDSSNAASRHRRHPHSQTPTNVTSVIGHGTLFNFVDRTASHVQTKQDANK
ncbi:hypothetical protein MTP99_000405 [Tenebrio molitor]|nr:hypothetical protein MTP99_000405 [Tenebrio molitor]